MYKISDDSLIELTSVPQSCIGAPGPMVCASEHALHLAFYLEEPPTDRAGETVRVRSASENHAPCALVSFESPYAHMFGPPNDEALSGHPLASRGLQEYGVFEVHHSSWIAALERMNSVHPYHDAARFSALRHFIFSFHDSTFECIAKAFSVSLHQGCVRSVLRGVEADED